MRKKRKKSGKKIPEKIAVRFYLIEKKRKRKRIFCSVAGDENCIVVVLIDKSVFDCCSREHLKVEEKKMSLVVDIGKQSK